MPTPFTFPPPPPPPPKPAAPSHGVIYPLNRGPQAYGGQKRKGNFTPDNNASNHGRQTSRRYHTPSQQSQQRQHNQHDGHHQHQPGHRTFNSNTRFNNRNSNHHWKSSGVHPPKPPASKPARVVNPPVATAPSVPSFTLPIPGLPANVASTYDTNKAATTNDSSASRKKRKTNQLGLTPAGSDHEDSDVDEEAVYAAPSLKGLLAFEYNGIPTKLATPADIAAWVSERKRKWPTKARVNEKRKAELRRRLEKEQEEKRKARGNEKAGGARGKEYQVEKERKKVEKLRRELEKSERRLAEAVGTQAKENTTPKEVKKGNEERAEKEAKKTPKSKRNAALGIAYESETESEASSVSSSNSEESSILSTDSSSDDTSDVDDSDAAPEVESTRQKQPLASDPKPAKLRPKDKRLQQSPAKEMPPCKFFEQRRQCPKGRKCRFKHEEPPRKGLFQRMVEQEQQQADLLALRCIKALGDEGFLK
ncbi:hypothetical protein BDY21DRAFT_375398 [Lineolata rhizophorae]|uniref:C3H1-type domain-containing protein n=1 Tax=Lineolata rhizophorae TaxID=578093 RepID=A0A6A6NLZ2_9PEZI|nr:hypothetical protein BDY21DRAFT_375398 [Lineolata rhizophorae]